MHVVTTRAAARQLGVTYTQLIYLINCDRMSPPRKNLSNGYEWSEADIQLARVALEQWRSKNQVVATTTE
jgi:hypothetical protein